MGRRPELFNSGYYEYFKNIYSGYYEYFKNINSGYYEWLSGARENMNSVESAVTMWVVQRVHYYVSGAWEWYTRVVHESTWVVHEVHERSARE